MASKLIQNCIPVSFFPKKTNVNSNKTSIDVEHRRITGNQFYLFLCYLAPLNVFVFTLRTYKELVLIPVSKYLTKQNIDNRHSCLVLFSFFSLFHCFVFFILVVRLCFRFDFIVFFYIERTGHTSKIKKQNTIDVQCTLYSTAHKNMSEFFLFGFFSILFTVFHNHKSIYYQIYLLFDITSGFGQEIIP